MTPSGIEPATFRFVAQHLNHCATAVPLFKAICGKNLRMFTNIYAHVHTYICADINVCTHTNLKTVFRPTKLNKFKLRSESYEINLCN